MTSTKIDASLITSLLSDFKVEQIALKTGFTKDAIQSKISGTVFVSSFWLMIAEGKNTLSNWATRIFQVGFYPVTNQGIEHKIETNGVPFAKSLLEAGMKKELSGISGNCNDIFASFPEVYIEDSTCFTAHPQLSDHYKGSHARKEEQHATLKLQVIYELRRSLIAKIGIGDFRKNDQSAAYNILEVAESGSLALRDLGYFSLDALKRMQQKGIFFISRLKPGVNVYEDTDAEVRVNLGKFLEKYEQNGIIDTEITLGKEHKIRVRIVAQRLPDEVAGRRRQKAKEDRSTKANHSEEYYSLLGWTIIITNVPQDRLCAKHIIKAYGCRWRIEILFKAWKSAALNMQKVFKQKMGLERFEVTVYLALLYITQFCQAAYSALDAVVLMKTNEKSMLSLIRTYEWLTRNFARLCRMESIVEMANKCMREVIHLCTYKKRRDRQSFAEIYT